MLSDYIGVMSNSVDQIKLQMLERIDALFKSYTQVHTDILIGNLMGNNGSREYSDMLDEVYTFLEEGIDYIAEELGIDFAEIDLDKKLLVLETIKQAEDFEDSENIIRLFESDSSFNEKLTDLLAFVSGHDWTVFADLVNDVSKETITSLYSIHNNRLEQRDQVTLINRSVEIKRIREYIEKHNNTILEARVTTSGYRPGLPLKPIFNENIKELRMFEVDNDHHAAAVNIIGLLLVTNIQLVKLAELSRTISENIYKNVEFVAKVNTAINVIASEVEANG